MATRIGTEKDLKEMLENLIKLDHAACEAYEEAVERLDNSSYRQQLAEFKRDHERHIRELSPIVRAMGGNPPADAGAKEWLAEGKVALSSIMGDRAILKAMKSNENDTNIAYERVLERCPTEARDIVARGLADERRHCAWILAELGEGSDALHGRYRTTRRDQDRPGDFR